MPHFPGEQVDGPGVIQQVGRLYSRPEEKRVVIARIDPPGRSFAPCLPATGKQGRAGSGGQKRAAAYQ